MDAVWNFNSSSSASSKKPMPRSTLCQIDAMIGQHLQQLIGAQHRHLVSQIRIAHLRLLQQLRQRYAVLRHNADTQRAAHALFEGLNLQLQPLIDRNNFPLRSVAVLPRR